jgi:hypothetical protein
MARCQRDADCRTGYMCDPQWHACSLPGLASIVPRQCPAAGNEPARDAAFGASEPWSSKTSPGVYQFEPASALADDGGVVSVYLTRSAIFAGNKLGAVRMDGNGAVSRDVELAAPDRDSQFDPWLARGKDGTLYAVWYAFSGRDEHGEIALVTSRDRGASWSAPVAVDDPADSTGPDSSLDKPMVAVGPDPRDARHELVYVMYSAADVGLHVRASHDGGVTFGKTTTALPGIYGTVVVGGDGRVHVATLNGGPMSDAKANRVDYAVSNDAGATWRTSIASAGEAVPFFFSNPSVAVDGARRWIYVAYARGGGDGVWDVVIAASHDDGKTWSRTAIGDGCAIHMVPNTALDPATGTLHVAWYDSEGAAPGRFAHATCNVGATACTRRGAINDVPFAALSTERHGAKWIGEYETLLVDAKRRVLHAVWSQPVAEDGHAVARIFHAAAKL